MIEPSPGSPSESRLPRGPKPAACDLCHLWKTRCDKGLPSCSKCKSINVECQYSRSGPKPCSAKRPQGVRTYAKRKKSHQLNSTVFKSRSISKLPVTTTNIIINQDSSPYNQIITTTSNQSDSTTIKFNSTISPPIIQIDRNTNHITTSTHHLNHPKSNSNDNNDSSDPTTTNRNQLEIRSVGLDNNIKEVMYRLNYRNGEASKRIIIWPELKDSYFCIGSSITSGFLRGNFRMAKPTMSTSNMESIPTTSVPILTSIDDNLRNKLIELYFGCINQFYQIIHPPNFYNMLRGEPKSLKSQALICAICLMGSNFYPSREMSKAICTFLSDGLKKYITKLYHRPSLELVQIYALISFHISSSEDNPFNFSAWFYLGLGQRTAISLGLQYHCKLKSPIINQTSRRTFKVLQLNEILIHHCTGLPSFHSFDLSLPPKKSKYIHHPLPFIPSENSPSPTPHRKAITIKSHQGILFFKDFISYIQLLSQINHKSGGRCHSLDIRFLVDGSNVGSRSGYPSESEQLRLQTLETYFFDWYLNACQFKPVDSHKDCFLKLPRHVDLMGTKLFLYFLVALIDLNKSLVVHRENDFQPLLPYLRMERELTFDDFKSLSPTNKCIIASHLGMESIRRSRSNLTTIAAPYFWYCVVQFTFFLTYSVSHLTTYPLLQELSQFRLDFMRRLLKSNASRWEIIKGSYTLTISFQNRV